jgi:DNA-binding phage protein
MQLRNGSALLTIVMSTSPRPEQPAEGFRERLTTLIERQGALAAFARKCGIAEANLRAYLSRGVKPGLDHLVAIADAGGVTLDWLASGREPMLAPQPLSVALDVDRLEQALHAVEEGLRNAGRALAPPQFAELVTEVYDLLRDPETDVAVLAKVVRIAAKAAPLQKS